MSIRALSKAPKSRADRSLADESRHSSVKSGNFLSRTETAFHTISFFFTRLDGTGHPFREALLLTFGLLEWISLSATTNELIVATPLYTNFLGFIRLDVALLPFSWFLFLFWVTFACVFIAVVGLVLLATYEPVSTRVLVGFGILNVSLHVHSTIKQTWLLSAERGLRTVPAFDASIPS